MMQLDMVKAWLLEHKLPLAALAAFGLFVTQFGAAVGGGSQSYVAVNAPENSESIQVFAGQSGTPFTECPDQASVEIVKDGFTVFSNVLGQFEIEDCKGSIEIPYNRFARENGPYTAIVEMDGETLETPFSVSKIANWVFVRSAGNADAERTEVSIGLARAQAQPLQSAVFASGDLVIDIYWEECDEDGSALSVLPTNDETCKADRQNVFHATLDWNRTANTNVIIPWENLENPTQDGEDAPEGSYNLTATFHNDEALANDNVPMDPTVFNRDPPGNWFEVDRG